MTLERFFQEHPRVALGFSGGVDSAYLLWAALHYGADVRPYYIKTVFQPEFEFQDALRLGRELGVEISVIQQDILNIPEVAENPENRCYHCKTALFGALRSRAQEEGYALLLDGTNASDDATDRPGMKALGEMGVRSPLREAGLTKGEIRRLSREAGLFTWDKPAYACLATRIPGGTTITAPLLKKVETAEDFLFSLGFTDFRVRLHHGSARLQLPESQLELGLNRRQEILEKLSPLFSGVLLDLNGR